MQNKFLMFIILLMVTFSGCTAISETNRRIVLDDTVDNKEKIIKDLTKKEKEIIQARESLILLLNEESKTTDQLLSDLDSIIFLNNQLQKENKNLQEELAEINRKIEQYKNEINNINNDSDMKVIQKQEKIAELEKEINDYLALVF